MSFTKLRCQIVFATKNRARWMWEQITDDADEDGNEEEDFRTAGESAAR